MTLSDVTKSPISMSRHFSTLNITETLESITEPYHRAIVTMECQ